MKYVPGAVGLNVQLLDVAPDTAVLPRNHWYLYGDVPPLTVEANATEPPGERVIMVGLIETTNTLGELE